MPSKTAYTPLGHDGRSSGSLWDRRRVLIIVSVIVSVLLLTSFIWQPDLDKIKQTAQTTLGKITHKPEDQSKTELNQYPWTGAGKIHPLAKDSVLMIKTGHSVIYDRVPMHLVWPRPDIPKRFVYSDVALEIGNHQVIDALANASSYVKGKGEYKEYLRLNNLFRNHAPISSSHDGWMLDKWKFAPMSAHAWRNNRDAKWFVTIDGDTYIFWGTLMRWLATFDHTKSVFVGYDEIGYGAIKYYFAHGGAGYAQSQKLMDDIFLNDPEGTKLEAQSDFNSWPCGDCAYGVVIGRLPNRGKHLDAGGDLFQHDGYDILIFRKRLWHSYLISLHHNSASNLMDLREFEEKLLPTLPEWDGVRYCDLWEGFSPEFLRKPYAEYKAALQSNDSAAVTHLKKSVVREGWKSGDVDKESCDWNCAKEKGVTFDVAHCEKFCEDNPKCFGWLMSSNDCTLSINGWRVGHPAPANQQWTSGWRLDRIAAVEQEMPCKNSTLRRDADERGHGVGPGRGSLEHTGMDDGWVLPPKGEKTKPQPLPEPEEEKKKVEKPAQAPPVAKVGVPPVVATRSRPAMVLNVPGH
ncbi:hypothetical protein OC846_006175 [Tilletia horrida]|uniref:Fringe-like glycosyltransferase domain-containing protein n=1 Tax=Tilletia horrida TaxID=155126 RepID=A0AAN6GP58_9BASI|nr:hypothetical protein OC846_006175 [Tilletia horrida]KAK0544568.1 hypothetical protein OC845_005517 [Tilletia horrida]KAK0559374.1 hypothetical protein OC861_006666 [Tilletia horrida]